MFFRSSKPLRFSLTLLLGFLLVSGCGEDESASSQVTITQLPATPFVTNTNLFIEQPGHTEEEPNIKEYEGPWFRFAFDIINDSPEQLIVASWSMEVESADGQKMSASPELPEGQVYITEPPIQPGETWEARVRWIIDGLPEMENGNFKYRVEVTFDGFFIPADSDDLLAPTDRFTKKIRFSTE
jgi:hypothetical protein